MQQLHASAVEVAAESLICVQAVFECAALASCGAAGGWTQQVLFASMGLRMIEKQGFPGDGFVMHSAAIASPKDAKTRGKIGRAHV